MNNLIKANFSKVKVLHFIGIGGIGMSGIAEMFLQLGYIVKGTDIKENNNILNLRNQGANVKIGHDKRHIENADIVVISSAITEENEEYQEAIRLGIAIFTRAQMLRELMRFKWSIAVAGTHGKTTTTSLISHIMQFYNLDPTAIIGGIVNSWKNNSRFGASNWIVAESDESDGSFIDLPATISVITNIESEHMDHYKDYDDLKNHFSRFINSIPFYGFSVVCIDSIGVQDIMPLINQKPIITYGFSTQSDYRAVNIRYIYEGIIFDVECEYKGNKKKFFDIFIPMYGDHNVLNALAAIAVCDNIDIEFNYIRDALKCFQGVKRRFTNIGYNNGIVFIDDYAHHPTEITAVIDAANKIVAKERKILSIVQPHRYSRLRDHFEDFCKCFNNSHHVWVLDVYRAREEVLKDYDAKKLVQGIKSYGHKSVEYVKNYKDIVSKIKQLQSIEDIEIILFMGAGSISEMAKEIFEEYQS